MPDIVPDPLGRVQSPEHRSDSLPGRSGCCAVERSPRRGSRENALLRSITTVNYKTSEILSIFARNGRLCRRDGASMSQTAIQEIRPWDRPFLETCPRQSGGSYLSCLDPCIRLHRADSFFAVAALFILGHQASAAAVVVEW